MPSFHLLGTGHSLIDLQMYHDAYHTDNAHLREAVLQFKDSCFSVKKIEWLECLMMSSANTHVLKNNPKKNQFYYFLFLTTGKFSIYYIT